MNLMNNIIDFAKAKLQREREIYEQELDTPIMSSRREIETIAIDIVMEFAELHEIENILARNIEDRENG